MVGRKVVLVVLVVTELRGRWTGRRKPGQAEPQDGQARTSGLEPGSCLSRRVPIRFVSFRKSLKAEKRLDWRSRKWTGPALHRQRYGEM